MTANPHTIDKDSTVTDAARKMTELNVKRLPVITAEGLLEGIVSRADVMRAFARSDEALRDEVIASFEPVLLADGDDVTVEVQNGVVEISGRVAFHTGARLLEELASRVEGVMSVSSTVTYETDDVDG